MESELKTMVAHESKNLEYSNPILCLRNQNFRLLFKADNLVDGKAMPLFILFYILVVH
jgi:hypothetical protein